MIDLDGSIYNEDVYVNITRCSDTPYISKTSSNNWTNHFVV